MRQVRSSSLHQIPVRGLNCWKSKAHVVSGCIPAMLPTSLLNPPTSMQRAGTGSCGQTGKKIWGFVWLLEADLCSPELLTAFHCVRSPTLPGQIQNLCCPCRRETLWLLTKSTEGVAESGGCRAAGLVGRLMV